MKPPRERKLDKTSPRFLSFDDLKARLQVGETTLRKHVVPHLTDKRIGRRRLFTLASVEQFEQQEAQRTR